MFTGLIAATGRLDRIERNAGAARIRVYAPQLASALKTGDSIAVSGVCLTALDITAGSFSADLAAETIARTSLGRLSSGATLNLELPTPAGAPLGGHIVQGHVDAVGMLLALSPAGAAGWDLRVRVPAELTRYIVPQGSIAIDGISLTVAALEDDAVRVAVIPHTYSATNLHTLAPGAPVNIETDVLAKYAEKQARSRAALSRSLTVEELLRQGF